MGIKSDTIISSDLNQIKRLQKIARKQGQCLVRKCTVFKRKGVTLNVSIFSLRNPKADALLNETWKGGCSSSSPYREGVHDARIFDECEILTCLLLIAFDRYLCAMYDIFESVVSGPCLQKIGSVCAMMIVFERIGLFFWSSFHLRFFSCPRIYFFAKAGRLWENFVEKMILKNLTRYDPLGQLEMC